MNVDVLLLLYTFAENFFVCESVVSFVSLESTVNVMRRISCYRSSCCCWDGFYLA